MQDEQNAFIDHKKNVMRSPRDHNEIDDEFFEASEGLKFRNEAEKYNNKYMINTER